MFEGASNGCTIVYYSSSYNMCDGWFCEHDWNCASNRCCGNYCQDFCGTALAWLWWTLSFIFLFMCIMSCVAAAKRRRRMEAMAAMNRNNRRNDEIDAVIVTTQVQPQQPQGYAYGQPVQQPANYAYATVPQQPGYY